MSACFWRVFVGKVAEIVSKHVGKVEKIGQNMLEKRKFIVIFVL